VLLPSVNQVGSTSLAYVGEVVFLAHSQSETCMAIRQTSDF
jgi:hypothetical protein